MGRLDGEDAVEARRFEGARLVGRLGDSGPVDGEGVAGPAGVQVFQVTGPFDDVEGPQAEQRRDFQERAPVARATSRRPLQLMLSAPHDTLVSTVARMRSTASWAV